MTDGDIVVCIYECRSSVMTNGDIRRTRSDCIQRVTADGDVGVAGCNIGNTACGFKCAVTNSYAVIYAGCVSASSSPNDCVPLAGCLIASRPTQKRTVISIVNIRTSIFTYSRVTHPFSATSQSLTTYCCQIRRTRRCICCTRSNRSCFAAGEIH